MAWLMTAHGFDLHKQDAKGAIVTGACAGLTPPFWAHVLAEHFRMGMPDGNSWVLAVTYLITVTMRLACMMLIMIMTVGVTMSMALQHWCGRTEVMVTLTLLMATFK